MSEKFGFIISIEEYQASAFGLPSVEYATNDGESVKDVFINIFGVNENNIYYFKDDKFTCASGRSQLKYYLKMLPTDAEVYFYYAGHGFFYEGKNYITAFDTNNIDYVELVNSSIPMEECIFDVVKSAGVKSFVAFIDACAEGISGSCRGIESRGLNLSSRVFEDNTSCKCAIYFACAPNEKAIPDDELQHGVWTWFLIQALNGDEKAFDKGKFITTNSLQEYLLYSVREFTKLRNKQTPYCILSSSENWKLVDYSEKQSFEEEVYDLYETFMAKCDIACDWLHIGNSGGHVNNFADAREVCKELSEENRGRWENLGIVKSFDNLCDNWEETVSSMEFCVSMLDKGRTLGFSYAEQRELLEDFGRLISSLPVYHKFSNDFTHE